MIAIAVETLWASRGGVADCPGYSREFGVVLKRHGSFNDDYDIAWMLLNLAAFRTGGTGSLAAALPAADELARITAACTDGNCVAWARNAFGETYAREETRGICAAIYIGEDGHAGTYRIERPMLRHCWSTLPLPAYVYTGRNLREWRLAQEILGWRDFPDERVVHLDTGMQKPSPAGLLHLCAAFGHHAPIFFGDTMSDKKAHDAFGKGWFAAIGELLPEERYCCASVDEALFQMMGWKNDEQ